MTDVTGTLIWMRPNRLSMRWELKKGEELVGTMSPPQIFGTSVTASWGEQYYAVKRGGFRRPGAWIRKVGEEDNLATMTIESVSEQDISFPDGSLYHLSRIGTTNDWTLDRDEEDEAIFTVNRGTEGKAPVGTVEIITSDVHLPELLLLCWFVISTAER